MRHLSVDIETYSNVDIKKSGLYKYAQSPDFEILLFAYSFDGGPVEVVDLAQGEQLPADILSALQDPGVIKHAYNAAFEWYCINRFWPSPLEQWRCTMVHGLYCGYPAGLANVAKALQLNEDKQKMSVGAALIRTFCVPCKPTKANGGRTRTLPHHEPEKWALFKEYCRRDVEVEMEVARRLAAFPVPEEEQRLWVLDQRINAYGVAIDTDLVDGALAINETVTSELMDEAVRLSGLDNPNSVQQLTKWLTEELGEEVTDLRKDTVETLLQSIDDGAARRMLEIRQELSKASVKKYAAMRDAVCADGRARGLLQFYGASRTGRWCLAEGTPVLVRTQEGEILEKPIESVLLTDRVWDGEQWVTHEGVVFSGDRDVITWDGITATPEHIVYISDTESMPLAEAKRRGLRLWRGNSPFTASSDQLANSTSA
ncbi:hypothetical protein [Alicyclobacillus sendaiensis]|uniref:hypothetical protein n=1 Tax=Alicyclobacillus sendaiensis TaxID=192387 RepID=UPI0026F410D7|nr:hypothetical protein [Alicyclobacillus sendaiensis]